MSSVLAVCAKEKSTFLSLREKANNCSSRLTPHAKKRLAELNTTSNAVASDYQIYYQYKTYVVRSLAGNNYTITLYDGGDGSDDSVFHE